MSSLTRRAHASRGGARSGLVAGATLLLGLALPACAPTVTACPAIGWINELTIQLEGHVSEVAKVQLCIQELCVPADDGVAPDALEQVAPMPEGGTADTWLFSTGMSTPDAFTVRVLSTDGTILTDVEAMPEWVRVGGSEQCGGPGEATVTVRV